jgi:hypothetical protein
LAKQLVAHEASGAKGVDNMHTLFLLPSEKQSLLTRMGDQILFFALIIKK